MPSTKVIEVLYCCSDSEKDEQMRQKLDEHLSPLKSQVGIISWHQGMISPGREWEKEINTRLETADIILLLISSEFTASEYHWNVVVKQAMQRHKNRTARVIPVLLRRVDNWKIPFGKIKALPKGEKPVTDWKPHDNAFANIAEGIREVVEELTDSNFLVKKTYRRIRKEFISIGNIIVNLVRLTFYFLLQPSRHCWRNQTNLINLSKQIIMVALAIYVIVHVSKYVMPQKSDVLETNSSKPNQSMSSKQNFAHVGWIRIGTINDSSHNFSNKSRFIETPNINSRFIPLKGTVVTITNLVSLKKYKPEPYDSKLPPEVDKLQPGVKVVILEVDSLVKPKSKSPRMQIWAQIGKCHRTCNQ
ncbi:MAG: toll/interleukin-1 receptor domain-containing protein [Pelatocladus maniniholoensis HA4357-MV3]|jgi:hypothetical protein|uniref:Toll/interleukin-1 receptor domain-containing protein n=1 Tax=Pelatocladus maniniholoensis HA4357-MV3 TaxID=1117104 RepID=A0A9E3HBL8_9NOST|nr:toll/interleukin-1 receptor domain-containing protein [Pelatocladus maniniholoensis HA4357-MV3]BAZ67490.1 hypothetical protein NIES4106_22450 [Fischerella sp. NIES-4106]